MSTQVIKYRCDNCEVCFESKQEAENCLCRFCEICEGPIEKGNITHCIKCVYISDVEVTLTEIKHHKKRLIDVEKYFSKLEKTLLKKGYKISINKNKVSLVKIK